MKVGIFTNCFKDKTWEEVCIFAKDMGFTVLEVGAGALHGTSHCNPIELMKNDDDVKKFVKTAEKHGLEIGSLSCMGNYLHPNKKIAEEHTRDLEAIIKFAVKTGVKVVNGFAGCPGAQEDAIYPNWIGLPYPPEFAEYAKWQWKEKIIPFWKEMSQKIKKHNLKYGFEMHPGDAVYNTGTMLRIREATNDNMGCCYDPTHLFWQQIDPVKSILALGDAVVNVHAQDSTMNARKVELDGILDPASYEDYENRPWHFKLVGYGHDEHLWKNIISALRRVGFDGSINVENQDPLMSQEEGFRKASKFLDNIIYHNPSERVKY